MDKKTANEEAKRVYDDWMAKREAIENEAKKSGKWNTMGLDANAHLFKQVDEEAKEKLERIKSCIKG